MSLSAAFRSSASLLSSRSLSRLPFPRAAIQCQRRCYSDEKPSSSEQPPTQDAQEKPPSPEAQALKAKEAEVADLTVRQLSSTQRSLLTFFSLPRVVYATCKLIF